MVVHLDLDAGDWFKRRVLNAMAVSAKQVSLVEDYPSYERYLRDLTWTGVGNEYVCDFVGFYVASMTVE